MPPSTEASAAGDAGNTQMVKLTFLVPSGWRNELVAAARQQGISMADLCRMVLRQFLRQRYGDQERQRLLDNAGEGAS